MITRILLLLTCVAATGAVAQETGTVAEPEVLMRQAQAAFDEADIVGAMTLYRQAAEAGHAPAQARLAYLLDNSEANEEAVIWFRKAAEQGNAEGRFGLARMYAEGEGVEKDPQEAVKWFTLAAQQGHTPSIRVMALACEEGNLGLNINYAQAITWLNAGVAAQDAWSTLRLSRAYRRGELGQRIDPARATALEDQLARIRARPAGRP